MLSGNLRAVSRIKLEVFDLDQYLDLAGSAYGDDHDDRAALVSLAQRRAALAAGVQIIAVATGKSSINELVNAGATSAITHLREVRKYVA